MEKFEYAANSGANNMEKEGGELSPEQSAFGMLDMVLSVVIVVIIVLLARRFIRKKKNDEHNIKPILIGKPLNVSTTLTGNFVDRMKSRKKNVIVFYGSQTGTAEEFATRLSKDASRLGMPAITFDPEECSDWEEGLGKLGKDIEGSLVIFCMATYGEGDPTDNAQEFYDWLKETSFSLDGLKYTVFALGNKTYEHYNAMGRYIDERLEELGAERIYKRGEGDDDANIEEDFVTWKEGLWPSVAQYYGIDSSQATQVRRDYELTIHTDLNSTEIFSGEPHKLGSFVLQKPPFNTKNPYIADITVNRELHKGGDRSCMHIEIDISDIKMSYVAGDHVAILPANDKDLVNRIGELLSTDLDTVFSLTNLDDEASKPHPFPCPTTYRTALTYYVDITSTPRTHVLRELVEFASDPKDAEFILKITSPSEEGKHDYSEWIVKDHRNIITVLEDLPSFRPPLDHLLELLPRLQVRYYSISSSPKLHPKSIHITAVLVEYQTRTGRTARGVATSWLRNMVPTDGYTHKIPIYIRRSSLRLPFRPINPVVMIGPGTGLAPFRGFIQDRAMDKKDKSIGDTVLYFGCRNQNEDFIYQDELTNYKEEGVLSRLYLAFSRDQTEKVYVQHKMEDSGEEIWKNLENQGFFYVCGDARNMARDVQNTLLSIIKQHGRKTDSEASEYVKKLQKRGHYLQDVWF